MVLLSYDPDRRLPTAEELPHSDDTPVDNELQNDLPNLLLDLLHTLWATCDDWFWGVDMGVYYHPDQPALIPDGFLSLGVPRMRPQGERLSYLIWHEQGIVPILFLEVISQTYGGEYDSKLAQYEAIGIPYYVIYNPFAPYPGDQRRRRGRPSIHSRHQRLEVYKLQDGQYALQPGNPVWLPELGLGLGYAQGSHRGRHREWLYWYDAAGRRYPTFQEQAELAKQRVSQVETQLQQTVLNLLAMGLPIAQVTTLTGLSEEQVQTIDRLPKIS